MYTNPYRVNVKDHEFINLFVFGDTQFGARGVSQELWNQFEEEFKSTPNAYAYNLGDVSDFIRPTIRERIDVATNGDISAKEQIDSMVEKEVRRISDKFDFLFGRIVGIHSGHHEWTFVNGTNATQKLCEYLRCPYLGFQAYTVLYLCNKKRSPGGTPVKILSTHGQGNALFTGSDLRNLEAKMAPYWNADLYLRGHSCKSGSFPMTVKDVTTKFGNPKIISRTRLMVNNGGFMEGYTDGEATYVERKQLPPAALSYTVVKIRVRYDFNKNSHAEASQRTKTSKDEGFWTLEMRAEGRTLPSRMSSDF